MARYLLLHVLVIVFLSEFGEAKNVKKTNFVSKSGKINYAGEELPTPIKNVSYLINPKSFLAYEEQFDKIKSLGADVTCKLRGTCGLRKRHKISKKSEKHAKASKKTMQSYSNNDIPDNRNQVVSPDSMMGPMSPSMMEPGTYTNQPNAASYGQQPQMDLKIPNMAEGMAMPPQGMAGMRDNAEMRANQENDQSIQNAIQSKLSFMDSANPAAMMQMPAGGPDPSEGDMGPPSRAAFSRHHGSRKEMHAPRGVPNGDSSSINDEDIYKAEGVQPNEMKDLHNFLSNSSQRHKSSEADDEDDDGDKDNRDRADSRDMEDNRDDRDSRYSKDSRHGRGESRPASDKDEREDEHEHERPYSSKGHGKEPEGNYEGRRHAPHRHTHPDPDMVPPTDMGPPSDIATANDIAPEQTPQMLQPLRAGTPEVPTLQNLLGGSMAMPDQGIPPEPSGLPDPMSMMQLGNAGAMDQRGRFVSDNNRNMIESNSDYDVPKTGKENTYIAGRRHRHHRSRKHRFHRRRMHRVQSHHLRDDFQDEDNDPNIAEAQGLMRNFNPMHGTSNDTTNLHEFADAEQKTMESRANARDRTPADPAKEEKASTSNSSTPTNESTTLPLTLRNTTAINSTAYNETIANLTSYINETVKNTTEEINVSLNNNVDNSTLVNKNETAALNNSLTPIEADKKNQSIPLNSSLTPSKNVGSKAPSKKSAVAYKPNQPLPPIYLTEKNGEKMLVVHPTAEFLRSLPRINFSSSEDNDKRTVGRQLPPAFLNQDIQIKEESPALRIRDDPADLKNPDSDLMEDHASNKRSRADIVARSKIFGNGKYVSIPVVSPAEANVGEWMREGRNRISTRGRPPLSRNSETDFSRDFQEQKEDTSPSSPDDRSLSSEFYRDISLHHGGLGKTSRKESIGSKTTFKNADSLTVPKEIQNIYQQYAPGQVKSNFNYVPSSDEVSEELKYAQNQLPKYEDKEENNYGHNTRNSQAESQPTYESEYSNQDYEPDNAAAFPTSWNNKETSEEESKRSETPIVFTRHVGFGPIVVEAKTADAPDDDLDE